MKIRHTPAPYPSTILELEPSEAFPYQDAHIQAITLDPQHNTYTLSGLASGKLRMYTLPRDTPLPPAVRPRVQQILSAEFAQYATPSPSPSRHLRAVPAPAQHTHLADPSGPVPTPAQQDSIRNSAGRTQLPLPPQPQHLAAPAHPARRSPAAHRAR